MTWILSIVILVLLFMCWLLFSPFLLEINSATASARFTWRSIGSALVWYDGDWWMNFRIFFFHKKMKLPGSKPHGDETGRRRVSSEKRKGSKTRIPFNKMVNCLKSFHIREWKLAIDTGDYPLNARLYPLNFAPGLQDHLDINFMDRNYCIIKITNAPWKILYAWLR